MLVRGVFKNYLVRQFGNTAIVREIMYVENDKMI